MPSGAWTSTSTTRCSTSPTPAPTSTPGTTTCWEATRWRSAGTATTSRAVSGLFDQPESGGLADERRPPGSRPEELLHILDAEFLLRLAQTAHAEQALGPDQVDEDREVDDQRHHLEGAHPLGQLDDLE